MPKNPLKKEMRQFLASTANDPSIHGFSDVLENQDDTLRLRGIIKGVKIFQELLRDGRVRSTLDKRKGKVTRREWEVRAADDSRLAKKLQSFVEASLKRLPFDRICEELLSATLIGYSVAEVLWRIGPDGMIVPGAVKTHDPARFVFDKDWRPRLLTPEHPMEGIALPERKFIVHRFKADGSRPYGFGLGSTLFWHVTFKREGVTFWLTFLKKFGSPIPFGRYPEGTLPEDQERLMEALKNWMAGGALLAPIGSEIELLQIKSTGDGGYENWCRYWDEQTAEVVLGETLSTSVKGEGSRAASEVHSEESHTIADGDADLLSATLGDQLIRWMVELNFGAEAVELSPSVWRPRPRNEAAEENAKTQKHTRQKTALEVLSSSRREGYEPADMESWMAELLETKVTEVEKQEQNTPQPEAEVDNFAENDDLVQQDDLVQSLTQQLGGLAAPHVDAWIATLREKLASTTSYAEAQRYLLEAQSTMPVDPLGNLLGDAFTLAELQGRDEVNEESSDG